ncbi:hypothetical protein QFC21_003898 [Naganishia friedmannii]|uniref:Uncharacterized protein n=1 Tax=Naganishia friedmannii TaxID=89922 RepID=A0ACC2VKH8_9TREE|nr:hypothetical protein QFC21_003898 [Naganishia friedmannii]
MSSVAARIAAAQAERDLSEAPVDIFHAFDSPSDNQQEWSREQDEVEEEEVGEPGTGRVSMYVRIVNEMFETVLNGEEYLFTEHEQAVLNHFLELDYEPKYLLTRLLLRKTNKIFSHNELSVRYSSELGEDNVAGYMDTLTSPLTFPEPRRRKTADSSPVGSSQLGIDAPRHDRFFTADELANLQHFEATWTTSATDDDKIEGIVEYNGVASKPVSGSDTKRKALPVKAKPMNDASNPIVLESSDDESGRMLTKVTKPSAPSVKKEQKPRKIQFKAISTGLTKEEEEQDPDLAKAIRESKLEALNRTSASTGTSKPLKTPLKVGDTQLGTTIKAIARTSTATDRRPYETKISHPLATEEDEFYHLREGDTESITAFARRAAEMTVEEMIRHLNMAELAAIAKALKCWKSKYTRPEIITALLSSANKQTRLSFTSVPDTASPALFRNMSRTNSMPSPLNSRQSTLAFTPKHANSFSGSGAGKEVQETPDRKQVANSKSSKSPVSPQTGRTILYDKIVAALGGRPIQVSIAFRRLIWRVNLVFYRSTITPSSGVAKSLMLPEILTSAQKRNYPEIRSRRSTIWPSRDALLEYERALELEAIVDESLGEQNHSSGAWVGPSGYGFGTKGGRVEGAKRVKKVWEGVWARWKQAAKRAASDTQVVGSRHVLDRFTLVYRPRLSRRLKRLEKQLDLPPDQRHVCEAELSVSEKRHLKAERLDGGAKAKRKSTLGLGEDEEATRPVERFGAKTLWQGRDEEVGVEKWVLEWWEDRGYKGFHSEASILTTLFGLLFWPILYMDIPGAFETPYQLAPLDLGDDSFYRSRQAEIEKRLSEMANTPAAIKMLREVDEVERERGTLAIGVNWVYELQDLEEIISCMGGESLSILCRMFCEEYGHRSSGVPDLIVWNVEEKKCRFVEVKSPNDHLSETQKVWISVMQSAGVDVEVCHVAEAAREELQTKRRRLNDGGWGKSKQHDYGDESDMQEPDEEDADGAEDRDQWRFEDGEEAKGKWKGEGRLLTKAQLAEAEDCKGADSGHDNKENFRLAKEGSRSLAATQTKRRHSGRPPTSTLRKTTSLEIRGDAAPIIIEL